MNFKDYFKNFILIIFLLLPLKSYAENKDHFAFVLNQDSLSSCLISPQGLFLNCKIVYENLHEPLVLALNKNINSLYIADNTGVLICPISLYPADNLVNCKQFVTTLKNFQEIKFHPAKNIVYTINENDEFKLNGNKKELSFNLNRCAVNDKGEFENCTREVYYWGVLPGRISINSSGNRVYVTNFDSVKSYLLDEEGHFKNSNFYSKRAGMFAITVNNKFAYITDLWKGFIYTCKINESKVFDYCGLGVEQFFDWPRDIVLNVQNNILYVTSGNKNKVFLCPLNINGDIEYCSDSEGKFKVPSAIVLLESNDK